MLDLRDQGSCGAGGVRIGATLPPGDIVGAAIAAMLIILVRGMLRPAEREADEDGDVRVP